MRTILLFWVGLAFIAVSPVLRMLGLVEGEAVWLAMIAGAVILIASRVEEIAELSLGPVKARMKETIAAANATIEQLRAVAVAIARPASAALMEANFMDGMTLKQRVLLQEELTASLRKLGASEQQIAEAEEMWRKGVPVIYHRAVSTAMNLQNPDQRKAYHEFQGLLDFANWKAPSPDMMEYFAKQNGCYNAEVEAWVSDYRHFTETNQLVNRDRFFTA